MADLSTPLGVVHGYGLAGAGSNLWTRAILRALAAGGHTVHAVCQESSPERYDFVSKAVAYDLEGEAETLFERDTDYPGTVTVHRPDLEVLPTYVRPSTPSDYVVYIPDLEDDAVEGYVEANARVLEAVAREAGVAAWIVNHTVLMAVAAHRARERGGAPYGVLPHGSAIEYVVKKEERSRRLAEAALEGAARVFALNGEMEGRIEDVFGAAVPGFQAKMGRMPVGTDTSIFELVEREDRAVTVEVIAGVVDGADRGRPADATSNLHARLSALEDDASDADLLSTLQADYPRSAPDADLEDKLRGVAWPAKTVVYVGRLIAAKGPADLVLALALVADEYPEAQAIIAGTGGLREGLEALVWALSEGRGDVVKQLVRLGGALEGAGGLDAEPLFAGQAFLDALEVEGRFDDYIATAQRAITPSSVVFTGFLDHDALGPLYGLADAGAFPSVVREASPLVVPESA
ncbi:MAG: hypothetical protein WBA11_13580, partial [Rubrivirga sp.]